MSPPVFGKVAPVVHFPDAEARVREFWRREGIFKKSLAKRAGGPRFVFYEGPPTANGLPHNGHALTRVMKDVIPRYKSMCGFDVPRKGGWDTHGLPVEIEVEKELRISGKDAILEYGVEPFVRRCLDSVFRYTQEWNDFTEKLGFWLDLDEAYVTYHESYIESVWWALSELFRKGLLYQGHKVVWWWAQGGTVLSAAEVGEGYRTVDDPSVYVRFPLVDEPDTSLLVWTTTPWTLPSNSLAAVKPDVDYAVVRDGERKLVVAEALVASLEAKIGRELSVESRLRGEALVGRRYTPPFDWFTQREPGVDFWRVVGADFVDLDAGTGIVHIAPAFGEIDFELLRAEQERAPELPLLCAVRPDGGFDPEIAPAEFAGRWVKACDRDLIRALKQADLCWHAETIRHEYPYCERADDDPLIQYARPAWYVRTSAHKEAALANNAAIRWLPGHIQEGRFGDFLRNNVDWALSRERFWGTPLNVWVNDETGAMEAPESVAAILERNPEAFDEFDAARRADPDLSPHLRVHKPWIDRVTWTRPGEPGVYRRVPEVIDAWFDSGSMPFAQWGYPHRGRAEFEEAFPADFISEAIDQTRGWFHALLWVSTLVFDQRPAPHPYKSCIVLGHVADPAGRKESKSKGNYTPPEIILDAVQLEFAAVAPGAEPPARGQARVAREDYGGLDLKGKSAPVRVCRADAPDTVLDLELLPARLPRRVIELSPEDAVALDVSPAATGDTILPREVPGLPGGVKVRVKDPASQAPGADAFRWFFYASNPPWNPTRHSLSGVRAMQRELPLTLRNVYAFFTIYANVDGFDPGSDSARAGRRSAAERALVDRWILSELALTTKQVREHMDAFRVYEATQVLTAFVEALSNWYVRRNRERFWAPGLEPDKLDVHWTLYECLVASAKLLAPFLPFAAEEMWQNLVLRPLPNEPDTSVHLCDYPEADESSIDEELSRVMGTVRELVSLGLQVRTAEKLRVRQPLASVEIMLADAALEPTLREHEALIRDELNVHEVHFLAAADDYVDYRVKPNFRALGPRVGKRMPALKQALTQQDGAALLRELAAEGRVRVPVDDAFVELGPEELAVDLVAREGYSAASGGAGVVVLGTELTTALVDEGLYREVLNRVQGFRKELDLEYTGRIRLTLAGAERLLDAVRPRVDALARETLAVEVTFDAEPVPDARVSEARIDGEPLVLGLTLVR
ncbi:MAG: isoleucine--tRNA ligase [Deltaproteobacteria bacterium]|nr:isoleucine--tRNA ligase [Deltaproteobacteria bacterium]MBW2360913.1 isoleucine--tRNA ligase [Deltaproteobacteria bacterium]